MPGLTTSLTAEQLQKAGADWTAADLEEASANVLHVVNVQSGPDPSSHREIPHEVPALVFGAAMDRNEQLVNRLTDRHVVADEKDPRHGQPAAARS